MSTRFTITSLRAMTIGAMFAGGLTAAGLADTITVCPDGTCDFTDPVAAVDAASDGDTILIAAGTYVLDDSLNLWLKDVAIIGEVDSEGRPATVLDGQGTVGQILSCGFRTEAMRFENLVITNGRADLGGGAGFTSSSPTLINCLFVDNQANWRGGAMQVQGSGSAPRLIGCEFIGNVALNPGFEAGWGGAIHITRGQVTMIDCVVSGNSAGTEGGGIFVSNNVSSLVLESSRVCGNDAPQDGQIGLGVNGSLVELEGVCITSICEECPEAPACPADIDADGTVGITDVITLLSAWATADPDSDLDGDGSVGLADLFVLLAAWGPC